MRGRIQWSNITPTSARWEQASSSDGGRTWVTNWTMLFQRETLKPTSGAGDRTAVDQFAFLRGDWHIHHRSLRVKDTTREWIDVNGTASNRSLTHGTANVEEHAIDAPSGRYWGLALRAYDPNAARWSIWWLDGRTPHGGVDPPMQGRFDNGLGTFYGDTTVNGKPMRARILWSGTAGKSPRWEQAYSADAGKTWETNWIMEFRRSS